MSITIEFQTLVMAFTPLMIAAFGGVWVISRAMIFTPLSAISKDLKDFKTIIFKSENRIGILELRTDNIEKSVGECKNG